MNKHFMLRRLPDNKKGYITLLAVLILGIISVTVVLSMLFTGVNSIKTTVAIEDGIAARHLAELCAEDALQEIRSSTPFSGTGSNTINIGSCDYTVENTGGQTRLIQATGSVDTTVQRVVITVSKINPDIVIASWQEVVDF